MCTVWYLKRYSFLQNGWKTRVHATLCHAVYEKIGWQSCSVREEKVEMDLLQVHSRVNFYAKWLHAHAFIGWRLRKRKWKFIGHSKRNLVHTKEYGLKRKAKEGPLRKHILQKLAERDCSIDCTREDSTLYFIIIININISIKLYLILAHCRVLYLM